MKLSRIPIEHLLASSLTKWRVKLILIIGAAVISLGVIFYAQYLANEIIVRETKIINFYAEIFRHYTSNPESVNSEEFDFLLYQITPTISFPMIMTDADDRPLYSVDDITNDTIYSTYTLNIKINQRLPAYKQREYLLNYINEMKASYPAIIVEKEDLGIVLGKFYYTHSSVVTYLRYFPLLAITVVAIFTMIGYIAFNYFRRNEESKVWVGMAKEAAHQLGTPLSSLLAWLEILNINRGNPDSVSDTVAEMQNDVDRLNKITTRFSKIGSIPEMKDENLNLLIEKICLYFEKRLPHLGKKVNIIRNLNGEVHLNLNQDLFEWVIENLLKNAAEAIDDRHGSVEISVDTSAKNKVIILVKDTGKGMTSHTKRQIFNPGFTTKRRGWGLGLTLSKRIVESYHNGKIYVKESQIGKGTTFCIELPLTN